MANSTSRPPNASTVACTEAWVAASVKQKLRARLFAKLGQLGPAHTERQDSGKIQAAVVDGVEALEGYFGSYVPQVLVTLTVPSAVLIYLFFLDVYVAASLLVAVLVALFAAGCNGERTLRAFEASRNAYSRSPASGRSDRPLIW